MQVNFAYQFRIYPNKEQKILLAKHFGSCRFVWNYFLNERKEFYLKNKEEIEAKRIKGSLNYYDNAKALTQLKQNEDYKWLNECNSQSLQACLKHLDGAYKMFFRKTHKFPNFKNKHHNLAKAISDCSWGTFTNMLEYKCNWYGKNLVKIGRFLPSSRICTCGVINKDLKLSDRVWTCQACNTTHDRDALASQNIKTFGLQKQNLIQVI